MKLWLIKAPTNWSDSFDSAVVAAHTAEQAQIIHPDGKTQIATPVRWCDSWLLPNEVTAEHIGTAKPGTKAGTVICASFNAG